jgi:hypothetical protein
MSEGLDYPFPEGSSGIMKLGQAIHLFNYVRLFACTRNITKDLQFVCCVASRSPLGAR